jgi:hypothetical protein
MKGSKAPGKSADEIAAEQEARALNQQQMTLITEQRAEIATRKTDATAAAAEQAATDAKKAEADASTGVGMRSLVTGDWAGYQRAAKGQSLRTLLGGGFSRGGDLGAT